MGKIFVFSIFVLLVLVISFSTHYATANNNGKENVTKTEIVKYHLDIDNNGITTDSTFFHEVTGLNTNIDITEYKEGGKNDVTHKHSGPAVFTEITLLGKYSATVNVPDDYVKNTFKGLTQKNMKSDNPTQVDSNVMSIGLDCNSFSAGGVTFQRVTDQNDLVANSTPSNFVIDKFVWSNALINTDNGKNALSDWVSDTTNGKNIRKNITVTLLKSGTADGSVKINFNDCLHLQKTFSGFNSKGAGEIELESLTLMHENANRPK